METIYKQKAPRKLTKTQFQAKLKKDSEYEIAVQNLSADFYRKKRSTGVTPQEEETYKTQKKLLWDTYRSWAIANGLYEEITSEQQLARAEENLNAQLEEVNQIRVEMGRAPKELK